MVTKSASPKKSGASASASKEGNVSIIEESMKNFMVNRAQKSVVLNFRAPEQLVERMDDYLKTIGGDTRGSRSAFLLKLIEEYLNRVGA